MECDGTGASRQSQGEADGVAPAGFFSDSYFPTTLSEQVAIAAGIPISLRGLHWKTHTSAEAAN